MNRDGHEHLKYFTGIEVEKSPAYMQKTLFVVGIQPADEIHNQAVTNDCTHVYLGANQSFSAAWPEKWYNMVVTLLDYQFTVTLDFDISDLHVLQYFKINNDKFIPMVSVKLPFIDTLPKNTTLKIDDIDFEASNPGVWCYSLQSLLQTAAFTGWEEYRNDQGL